jgi:hypothetical protein
VIAARLALGARVALVVPLACAGCLGAPTGLHPDIGSDAAVDAAPDGPDDTWPPPDLAVAAIAAGDVTGDGRDDLVVVSTPAGGAASVLLIDGASGLDYAAPGLVVRARASQPLDGGGPVAVTVIDGEAVLAYARAGTMRIAAFTGGDLHVVGDLATGAQAPAGAVWIDEVLFPGDASHVVLGAGTTLIHLATSDLATSPPNVPLIPSPEGGGPPAPPWSSPPVAIATYADGADRVIAVATEASLDRSVIPTAPPPDGTFAWTNVRSAPAWDGQHRVALDGDDVPEVVGTTRATPSELCAASVATGDTACAPSGLPPGGDITSGQLTPDATPDLVVVQSQTATSIAVLPNPTLAGGALTLTAPLSTTLSARAVVTLASLGHGSDAIVTMDAAGAATCHLVGVGALTSCEAP